MPSDSQSSIAPSTDSAQCQQPRAWLRNAIVGLLLTACLFRWAYIELRHLELAIRSAFAVEQTAIFEELLQHSRNDSIEGIRDYYPSGTKQVTGSSLDQLVERCRRMAIQLADCQPSSSADASRQPAQSANP